MSLSGKWHLSIASTLGEQKVELELVQSGDKVTGVSRNELEGETPLLEPTLDGNTLTWKSGITQPIKATATMTLTFDGDSCTGTAGIDGHPAAKVIGQRASS
jgi:hypothetical protein